MRAASQDKADIELAHKYRLSLSSSPSQSSFKVLALLFYEDDESQQSQLPPWVPQTTTDGRKYIVGTNDEPGYMGGAICAERAAMVQLRFVPSFQLTKLVIATDSLEPISPGMLCREFLAGHDSVPWELPVLSSGCICTQCQVRDDQLFSESRDCVKGTEHVIPTLHTTLRDLYPFPSPYTRLTALESVDLGESYCDRASSALGALDETAKRLFELAILEAKSNMTDLHPIQFGAAVAFADGSIVTSHQSSALEYGCTLDAVSQLASHFHESAPVLLVQADQYGIAHAPFAPARAFLTEHGFGDCQILLHETLSDVSNIEEWTLREIQVTELAPNAPSWTESTDRRHLA
jgi:cytidine deaminase